MNTSITELAGKIASQAIQIPALYGGIDFSITPERFTVEPDAQTEIGPDFAQRRPELLANAELVALIKAYTMQGDIVADAYVALMPQYGHQKLVTMLMDACDHGLESVAAAPLELHRFIEEMERLPAWLDPKLIEQGARIFSSPTPGTLRTGVPESRENYPDSANR